MNRPSLADRTARRRLSHRPARDEERALFLRYRRHDDVRSRDALVERFLPLARRTALRYRFGREPLEDLMQVATLGLIKAIDRFEPAYGTAFSTFAVPCIAGELKRHFRDSGWAVRIPRPVQERVLAVEAAVERLRRTLGRSPTPAEVADDLAEDVDTVLEAMEAAEASDAVSLDAPIAHDGDEPSDYASTVGVEDAHFEQVEAHETIVSAMHVLTERERLILRLRFDEDRTQAEIAAALGISQMHVSRLLRRSLERLRTMTEPRPPKRLTAS
jgi:RNA polymerase sigma-B factor